MPRKLTEAEADVRFKEMNVERLEPYLHSHKPILMRCRNGHQIRRIPSHVWRGIGCRVCNGTDSPTQDEAKKKFGDRGFELLGTYINSVTKVLTRCCECGHEWRTRPVGIITIGHGCPICALRKGLGRHRLPQSTILDRLKDRGIELLEPYKNAVSKILMRGGCGHEWRAKLADVFGGTGCKQCARNKPLTQEEVVKRYETVGLAMLEPYRGTLVRTLAQCNKCNRQWLSLPNDIFGGHGCSKCEKNQPLTQAEVAARFNANSVEMLEPYINIKVRILVRGKCGHEWKARPHNIFGGSGCPKCAVHGFRFDKPAVLYYIRVSNPFGEPVYKIGITNKTIRERFGKELSRMIIVETWHFSNGTEAFEMEQDILNDYDADRYEGPDILKTGNDELFNIDVLGLDTGRKGQLELVA